MREGAADMTAHAQSVAAVVLAAGLSRRLGRSKQLLPWRGSTLLGYTVSTLLHAGISRIAVVTGHDASAVASAVADLPVTLVHNPDFVQGQGTSVACGARWAQQCAIDRVLFVPCDQPFLSAVHIAMLLAADPHAAALVPRVEGQPTSPVMWAATALPLLAQLSGEQGGRRLFAEGSIKPTYIDLAAPELLCDIDTPEDYAALCAT